MKKNLQKPLCALCLLAVFIILTFPHTGTLSQAPQLNLNPEIVVSCNTKVSCFAKELTLTFVNQGASEYIGNAWPYVLEIQKNGQWYIVKSALLHLPIDNVNETVSVYPPGTKTSITVDLRPYGLCLSQGKYRIILDCYTTEAKYNDTVIYHSKDYLSCMFEVKGF